jgi:hypothetical protein
MILRLSKEVLWLEPGNSHWRGRLFVVTLAIKFYKKENIVSVFKAAHPNLLAPGGQLYCKDSLLEPTRAEYFWSTHIVKLPLISHSVRQTPALSENSSLGLEYWLKISPSKHLKDVRRTSEQNVLICDNLL